MKLAGGKDAFYRVDHDYVVAVARAARDAGAKRLALVSSVGASAASKNFYLRVKGKVEDAVSKLGYERITYARPGLLRGPRNNDSRLGESVAKVASPPARHYAVGQYVPLPPVFYPDVVARALVAATLEGEAGGETLEFSGLKQRAAG